jgi:hypothetical protein
MIKTFRFSIAIIQQDLPKQGMTVFLETLILEKIAETGLLLRWSIVACEHDSHQQNMFWVEGAFQSQAVASV